MQSNHCKDFLPRESTQVAVWDFQSLTSTKSGPPELKVPTEIPPWLPCGNPLGENHFAF